MTSYENYSIDLRTFAESVCLRPNLWLPSGRLEEAIALFEGYSMALRHTQSESGDPSPRDAMQWVIAETGYAGLEWSGLQTHLLRSRYGSDAGVFAVLREHLRQIQIDKAKEAGKYLSERYRAELS
ncbi:MAG: hypothetical protein AAFX40_19550 [Cyanobacteria bacterium J06639_1]